MPTIRPITFSDYYNKVLNSKFVRTYETNFAKNPVHTIMRNAGKQQTQVVKAAKN